MRRQALDGEGAGDADAFAVLVGLVVEVFELGAGGDRGVDLLLAGDAGLPEGGEGRAGGLGPVGRGLARDFPFHQAAGGGGLAGGERDLARGAEVEGLAGAAAGRDLERGGVAGEGGVEGVAGGLDGGLAGGPDHVDLGVVGDGFQRDVRHALVDEALADVVVGGRVGRGRAGDVGLLAAALGAVGEQVEGELRAHDPGAGQRQRHAGGVDGDPAPAPLLGDEGGGAGAAGRVEHEVAGVGGHEEAAFDDLRARLNHIDLVCADSCHADVRPKIVDPRYAGKSSRSSDTY